VGHTVDTMYEHVIHFVHTPATDRSRKPVFIFKSDRFQKDSGIHLKKHFEIGSTDNPMNNVNFIDGSVFAFYCY
jgi:hypothetical protein